MNGKREYGDYQTPIDFAERVCAYLRVNRSCAPSAVVEPTCGTGSFLKSSLSFNAQEYYGIEINPDYCAACQSSIDDARVKIINSDFFSFSLRDLIKDKRQILVIGNPPWVTNSTLSSLHSTNLPNKANFKGFKGIDAITGASNFDICEFIILQLIQEFKNTNTIISMLCKTTVARNVFKELKRNRIGFTSCDILEFDASKVFGISANACVLVVQLSEADVASDCCDVFDFEHPQVVKSRISYEENRLQHISGKSIDNFDGQCCFEWRQGVKHDCSKVMELSSVNGSLVNGSGETIDLEDDLVYPLIKSSMFKSPIIHSFSKYVIVTQKHVREKTESIRDNYPQTWQYLQSHKDAFERRKSSIYRDAPPFSMFGIGDYSYAKYKVGVSGFYKKPLFSLLYSDDGKPVMTDDTSYFIAFDSYEMAYVAMLILNSDRVQDFISSIAFVDSKRPYTKKVLERIDFNRIVEVLTIKDLIQTESELLLSCFVTSSMFKSFKRMINIGQLRLA